MNEGKDLLQGLLESALNYYSREAINKAIDFVASLSEDDMQNWTLGMSPEQSARVYRVWRASRETEAPSSTAITVE